jgi:hypothetical protein
VVSKEQQRRNTARKKQVRRKIAKGSVLGIAALATALSSYLLYQGIL